MSMESSQAGMRTRGRFEAWWANGDAERRMPLSTGGGELLACVDEEANMSLDGDDSGLYICS